MAIGQKLEEARNRKGISIREVTESTKIRGDYISSFEAGNFDINLPEVYLRGFVRLYARFLGLDQDATLADLDIELGTASTKNHKKNLGSINASDSTDASELSKKTPVNDNYYSSEINSRGWFKPVIVISTSFALLIGFVIFLLSKDAGDDLDKKQVSVVKELDESSAAVYEIQKEVESHLLNIAVVSPIEHLIICDEGQDPKKYYEFKNLPQGWEKTLEFKNSFRCYSSSLENFRFAVDDGMEKQVKGSGAGNFSWPTL